MASHRRPRLARAHRRPAKLPLRSGNFTGWARRWDSDKNSQNINDTDGSSAFALNYGGRVASPPLQQQKPIIVSVLMVAGAIRIPSLQASLRMLESKNH
jgi:hypothetical protein